MQSQSETASRAQGKEEVVTNCDRLAKLKFSPHLPFAFTERDALMATLDLPDRTLRFSICGLASDRIYLVIFTR